MWIVMTGDEIRIARNQRNLNQTEVATAIGVSQGRLSQIEKGTRRPSRKEIVALTKFFNETYPAKGSTISGSEFTFSIKDGLLSVSLKNVALKNANRYLEFIAQEIAGQSQQKFIYDEESIKPPTP